MIDLEKNGGRNPYRANFDVEERGSVSSYGSFTFKTQARNGFIRKVYYILTTQLLITVLFALLATNSKGFQVFMVNNMWLSWLCMFTTIGIMIALVCVPSMGKAVPTNYILLLIFTFAEAYTVSFMCIFFPGKTVLTAAILTAGVVVALTFYAITTKSDFTLSGGILYIVGIVLILLVFVNFFIGSSILGMLISGAFAILFGIYLVYDTQLIVGGKCAELELDDYILGALMLYTDIIGMFVSILQLLGNSSSD